MLRRRRLIAALSSVVLAACGFAAGLSGPAAAATGPAHRAAVSAPAASGHSGGSVRPSAPGTGTIQGVVSNSSGTPLVGLSVSVCEYYPTFGCATAITNSSGFYSVSGLPAPPLVTYAVTANAPPLLAGSNSLISLSPGVVQTANLVLLSAVPLPQTVSIPTANTPGPPIGMYYGSPHPFTIIDQCHGGTASFTVVENGVVIASGPMPESPLGSGNYGGTIPSFYPNDHGYAVLTITVTCGSITQTSTGTIWLDPSGTVISPSGAPIGGATVTLLSAPTAAGPFTPVPNGSAVMSPANRVNPGVTAADGLFGWDVIPGWYEVQAQKTGCFAPTSPPSPIAVSPVLQIPPAVTGLLLTLDCSQSPATSITSANSATFTAGAGGGFKFTSTGGPAPTWTESGLLPAGVSFTPGPGGTAALVVNPAAPAGVTTFTATAGNGVGSSVSQVFTLTINPANGPTFTSASSAGFTAGLGGTFSVTSTGAPVPIVSVSGALPPGVTFSPGSGGSGTLVVSGSTAPGAYPITFLAGASTGTALQSFILTVTAPAAAITSQPSAQFTLSPATLGGTFTVTSTGVPTPALSAGGLPPDVTFTPNSNGTGTLAVYSGAASGTYVFGITATNGSSTVTQTFTLTIN
jgi:hypothetical protein